MLAAQGAYVVIRHFVYGCVCSPRAVLKLWSSFNQALVCLGSVRLKLLRSLLEKF